MTTRIVAGKIGGIPVAGGYLPLETAELGQVINAATGLIRETANIAVGTALVGAYGLGMIYLLNSIAKMEDPEEKKRRERMQNPPRSLAGICCIKSYPSRYFGVCLNRRIEFVQDRQKMSVLTEHVRIIELVRSLWGDKLVIELVDGSRFEHIQLIGEVSFVTIAGISKIDNDSKIDLEVMGLPDTNIEAYKNELVRGLKQTRIDLMNEIGIDLVQKYFHIEEAQIIEIPDPPPASTLPATPATRSYAQSGMALAGVALSLFALGGAIGAGLLYML